MGSQLAAAVGLGRNIKNRQHLPSTSRYATLKTIMLFYQNVKNLIKTQTTLAALLVAFSAVTFVTAAEDADHMLRFAKGDPTENDHMLRFSKSADLDHMLRYARSSDDNDLMLRFARNPENADFMLRFAKRSPSTPDQDHMLRFMRQSVDDHLLRFGKRHPMSRFSRSMDDGHMLRLSRSD